MRPGLFLTVLLIATPGCLDDRAGRVAPGTDAADTEADAVVDAATPPDSAPTGADVVIDTTTAPPDVVEDTGEIASCDPPLRISPRHGGTNGGTIIAAEGQVFHIGAMTWMMKVGDATPQHMLYEANNQTSGECRIYFRMPPHRRGTYDVVVYYGWDDVPLPEPPLSGSAGSFTYE